ncbi:MalY/PatB family protein [Myceligenerans indicum]|uniref:cysteine-S-conjugate beta-lyase n=1 Tax=Myceligenerans indicum TaxID=2593663 RepID=A0ABS1LER4_9MICO|nr:aminotransferase class I/II-fold pyridoxal phosphate-dependent enzyme [Myceligenerans indicum]MBL0884698.1 aminotransferase class I/II-fold pyridoxal phosphate-dependent enzyme [Myceligenerans indicum]
MHPFDTITADQLRDAGSTKWTAFPGTIGAWVAEMDFGTSPEVTKAVHDAVDRAVLGYLPKALATEMSESYARFAADRYGWAVDPAHVRPVSDVLTALELVITHYSRPGSPIILPTPAYMPFLTLPRTLGRDIIQVPMSVADGPGGPRYTYDLDALDAAFAAGGHLMVLCNPHNPVGRVLTPDEMNQIAEVVDRHGGRVFADEIHAPLTFEPHRHVPYASLSETAAGHTVTATSASKAWNLPGMKCAQLVLSNAADIATWNEVGHHAEMQAATLGVVAARAAYDESRAWLDDTLAYLRGNYAALVDDVAGLLPGVTVTPLEGTYLSWLDCRELDLGDASSPAELFRTRAGVTTTDGALCGEVGKGFVRLNLAMPRPVLADALTAMGEAAARG